MLVVTLDDRRRELADQKAGLTAYCLGKVKAQDWHAVADAAMDIRELDAQLELIDALNIASADGHR